MELTPQDIDDELQHQRTLLRQQRANLRAMQLREAEEGGMSSLEVTNQMRQFTQQVMTTEAEIARLETLAGNQTSATATDFNQQQLSEELAHQRDLLRRWRGNLRQLKLQETTYGIDAPLRLKNTIAEINRRIGAIEAEINHLETFAASINRDPVKTGLAQEGTLQPSSTASLQANTTPQSSWKNWGDHPVVVFVGLLAGLIAIGGVLAPLFNPFDQPSSPPQTPVAPEILWTFETDIQGWDTNEGNSKIALLAVTTEQKHTGNQSLKLTTDLLGRRSGDPRASDEVYSHTVAKVYFSSARRSGLNVTETYDLTGRQASCYVYLPRNFANEEHQPIVRMQVKDDVNRNNVGEELFVDTTKTEQWLQVILQPGVNDHPDNDFDPTKVTALGVVIVFPPESDQTYEGPIYIDDCTIR